MSIDMRRVIQEHEEARRMDTEAVAGKLDQGLSNDHEIISVRCYAQRLFKSAESTYAQRLEIHRAQMQEAMIAIQKVRSRSPTLPRAISPTPSM